MTATLQDWLRTAETNYDMAVECFRRASAQADKLDPNTGKVLRAGDPQAFDQWLRMATWHVQAVGATVGLARATSDHAAR